MCVPGTLETVRERSELEGVPRVSRRVALAAGAGAVTAAARPGAASAGERHSGGLRGHLAARAP